MTNSFPFKPLLTVRGVNKLQVSRDMTPKTSNLSAGKPSFSCFLASTELKRWEKSYRLGFPKLIFS
jgi:hypothetical protein